MSDESPRVKWCKLDDYEVRGKESEEPVVVPIHQHLDKYRVRFEDGTIRGTIPPDGNDG